MIRNYLELARISNLPTTATNVLVGISIASQGESFPWLDALFAWLAVACFYIGGMALNDLVDASVDKIERPQRPIPSGRITPGGATTFTVIVFVLGLAIAALLGTSALLAATVLVVTIITYDIIHKLIAASVVLMGLCRGLVYVFAAASFAWPVDATVLITIAGAVTLYTTLFTIIARSENEETLDRRRWLTLILPVIALLPAAIVHDGDISWMVLCGLCVVAWMTLALQRVFTTPPQTIKAVLSWIAGMCLIDAFYLSLLGQVNVALACFGAFALTILLHRRILGT